MHCIPPNLLLRPAVAAVTSPSSSSNTNSDSSSSSSSSSSSNPGSADVSGVLRNLLVPKVKVRSQPGSAATSATHQVRELI